jgi:hypothetical protein
MVPHQGACHLHLTLPPFPRKPRPQEGVSSTPWLKGHHADTGMLRSFTTTVHKVDTMLAIQS